MCRYNSGVRANSCLCNCRRISSFELCSFSFATLSCSSTATTGAWSMPIRDISSLPSTHGLIRPDITFFCDLDYDPFLFMQDNEKVYGMLQHQNTSFDSNCLALQDLRLPFLNIQRPLKHCGTQQKVFFLLPFDLLWNRRLNF